MNRTRTRCRLAACLLLALLAGLGASAQPAEGTRFTEHLVKGGYKYCYGIAAADLDGDGDLDAAISTWRLSNKFVWFENAGDPRGKWALRPLKSGWARANQIIAADLNGDKRPDLVAGAEIGANEVRWWRNEGSK